MKLFVKKIDLCTWKRRQHFELFSCYANPYWSVTINIDCTKIYQRSKQNGFPFYLGYYYTLNGRKLPLIFNRESLKLFVSSCF
ncbi:MAG: hypothetical protein LBU34_17120 [Planctomycetaceae bacterium]|nr:hypothetical protein [Planctomycetaceae bacterium]